METCGSAHYWARKFVGMGDTVKLMAPRFVKPYVKTYRTNAADAEAICAPLEWSIPSSYYVDSKLKKQEKFK